MMELNYGGHQSGAQEQGATMAIAAVIASVAAVGDIVVAALDYISPESFIIVCVFKTSVGYIFLRIPRRG